MTTKHHNEAQMADDAKQLTADLWPRLKRRTAPSEDDCSIRYSGYHVMVRHLFRWQGSIYTLLWLDMLIWCIIYAVISAVYRLALSDEQKTVFENVVQTVSFWSAEIPITFLLGFFVSNVVSRWWTMYSMIPKMGGPSGIIRGCLQNCNPDRGLADSKRAEVLRRTISRYMNLAWVLCIWQFSGHIRDRYDTLRQLIGRVNEIEPQEKRKHHIQYNELYNFRRQRNDPIRRRLESIRVSERMQTQNLELMVQDLCLLNEDPIVKQTYGDLITHTEIEVFAEQARRLQDDEDNTEIEEEPSGCCGCSKQQESWKQSAPQQLFGSGKQLYKVQWWLPLHWALALAEQAMEEGFVHDTNTYVCLTSAIHAFAGKLTSLGNYATRNLPLVYTQVVIIAVYTIYLANILSKQFLNPTRAAAANLSGYWLDYYVPIFALLQIVFIVGWFKVALVLMDPFGSDDQDFPLGDIFINNLKSGIEMSQNSVELYPKKLRQIICPSHNAKEIDEIESDVDDSQPVLLSASAAAAGVSRFAPALA